MGIQQALRKGLTFAAQRTENGRAEKCKHQGEQQANAQPNEGCMQNQGVGLGQVVGPHGTADGRGNAATHGACRQHLLQHHQWKYQGHARQGHDAQLTHIPSLGNADQSGSCHGQAVGQG